MKRKMIALLCATVVTVSCVGCAGRNATDTNQGTQQADTQTEIQTENALSEQGQNTEQTKAEQGQDTEKASEAVTQNTGKVEVTYEQIEESYYAEDKVTELMNANYQRPTVTIEGNQQVADAINQSLEAQEKAYTTERDELKTEAESAYSSMAATDFYAYWLSISYETQRVDSHVVSMRQMHSADRGGAHGENDYSGYNYDAKTGAALTLETIATDKEALTDSAEAYILEQLEQPYYAEQLYEQGETNKNTLIKGVVTDGMWYFADAGLTFISNAYTLAPYAAGTWYFTVPYDRLEGLKAEYNYDPEEMAWQMTVPLGIPMSADLDGDGAEDSILYNVTANPDGSNLSVTFTINDVDYSGKVNNDEVYITDGATWTPGYYVVDIDKNDSFKEIAIMDNGASDDFVTYFFRYTGQEVVYLGCVNDQLSYSSCRANGDGTITADCRLKILETANFIGTYEIGNEGKLELRRQDMYDIDNSHFSPKYASHNILKDVTVYTRTDQSADKKTLTSADGPVTFTRTDNEHWVELVTAGGDAYYLYFTDYITLETGEDAQTVFENLPLAD